MIVKGGARSAGGFFAKHLMKAEENERVAIVEMKGLYAEDLPEAFREMKALAAGSRGKDFFYHCSINPRDTEHLTPEQWDFAVDRLEQNLGMGGHARFQVEHEKEGRTHRHIVWSRVDPETLTLANHWRNYEAHDKTRAELEQAFNQEPTPPTPAPDQRKSREFADWENFRAAESGIGPKEVKAEITALYKTSDSGPAFVAALEEAGYTLCQGDRGYCIVDQAGDVHSLVRRIEGVKTAELRMRLADFNTDSLMTVQEATVFARSHRIETKAAVYRASESGMQGQTTTVAGITDQSLNAGLERAITPQNIYEFKEAVTDSKRPIATSIEKFSEAVTKTMQANHGELHIHDGLTWWQRMTIHLETIGEKLMGTAKGMWQEFIERFPANRDRRDRDGFEFER